MPTNENLKIAVLNAADRQGNLSEKDVIPLSWFGLLDENSLNVGDVQQEWHNRVERLRKEMDTEKHPPLIASIAGMAMALQEEKRKKDNKFRETSFSYFGMWWVVIIVLVFAVPFLCNLPNLFMK